jgi:penicillin-binding protein 1A
LPTDLCAQDPRGSRVYTEIFIKGRTPTESCSVHVSANVVKNSDGAYRLAGEFCPASEVVKGVFITRPNMLEDQSWRSASDAVYMVPTEKCIDHTSNTPKPSPSSSATTRPSSGTGTRTTTQPSTQPPTTQTTTPPVSEATSDP